MKAELALISLLALTGVALFMGGNIDSSNLGVETF